MSDSEYLRQLTRLVFSVGFNRTTVAQRWEAFEHAFMGFDPEAVAGLSNPDIEVLAATSEVIRNRAKLRAVRDNARHFVAVAKTHGSFGEWLTGMKGQPYEVLEIALIGTLAWCGPQTAFQFLLEVGMADLSDKPDHVNYEVRP